ncbi:MAG: pSer/pThr/pTyr-binding forkhead associated (FHA) protein [Myxococcota bacterium]|jgi:pSer/pThr/pTyr-binding forkhead associated (FHA) protein
MTGSVEVIVKQSGRPDRVVPLREGTSRMGRADDSEIVLSDVGVSRRHSRIIVNNGTVRVEDLGSGNGTYVRGQRVDRQPLTDGDEIVIDPFVIQVRMIGKHIGDHTPQVPLRARLDVVTGPTLAHTTYPIPARGLTVGRSDTRDVILPDPAGSRHHCSIFLQQRVHVLRDMGSANGVYVNGQRVDECTLNDGDIITIGNTELKYVSDQAARQSTARGRKASNPAMPPRPRSNDALSWVFVAATLFTVGVLALVAALAVFLFRSDGIPQVTTLSSGPPSWSLTLSEAPETNDPVELSRQGVALVSANDDRAALERFWLLLRARPGYESGEVFAYAAGEHLVVNGMRPELYAAVEARETYEAARDELIAENSRASRRTLEREYSDDPIVRTALGLGPSRVHVELQSRLIQASEMAANRQCADAITVYDEVLHATQDDSLRQAARSGRVVCQRELARQTQTDWSVGVRAQAEGDKATARDAFARVLAIDPANPSARFRMALLQ